MSDQHADWISISDAARSFRLPPRTLYAYVERESLSARKIRGVLHVQHSDVARLASSRSSEPQRTSPDAQSVATARERVALKSLEGEELRAAVSVERTREELSAAEAERSKRRELLTVETERARLALEKDRAEHARELQAEANRLRAAEHQRALELERERERRERQQEAAAAASERAAWEKRWLGRTLVLLREYTGGTEASGEAIVIADDTLKRYSPDDLDALVEINLAAALRAGLDDCIARWREHLAEQSRATLVSESAGIARRKGREAHERVLRAARAAAAAIDPHSPTQQQYVRDAARVEYESICNEERAQEELREKARREEADRDREARNLAWEAERQARQEAEERRKEEIRRSDWRMEQIGITGFLIEYLPRDANAKDWQEARATLEELHAKMSPAGNPFQFRGAARPALEGLRERIQTRLSAARNR